MPRSGIQALDSDVVIATEEVVLDARRFNVLYGVFSCCGADVQKAGGEASANRPLRPIQSETHFS